MKKKNAPHLNKVHFISLGCPKNLIDSEIMVGSLIKENYEIVPDETQADIVIVNTCGFIEDAKKESISRILDVAELKAKNSIKKIVVTGCLIQRYKEELVKDLPEVDAFVGTGEFQNIAQILHNTQTTHKPKTYFNLPTYLQEDSSPRINTQPGHRAYIKISEGCLKRCAFCAIPKIRGNLQSRTIKSIVAEAKTLARSGVKELNIISHDFTDYGWDLRKINQKAKESPVNLLRALSDIKGLQWIRVLYLYPDGITQELIQLIKERKNLVKYFDMPLQHISDSVLKRMNRRMSRDEIETVIQNIKEAIPSAVIRTQFIVGFPGETDKDFKELMTFIKTNKFDRVGCFKYSNEDGTAGASLSHQVDEETKEYRHNTIMQAQQKISKSKHKAFVGKTVDVLIEGESDESDLLLQGRLSTQAPEIDGVVLITKGCARVGEIVKVKIVKSLEYDLIGEIRSRPRSKKNRA